MSRSRRALAVVIGVLVAGLIAPTGAFSAGPDSDSASGLAVVKIGKRCKKVNADMDVTAATKVTATVVSNLKGVAVQRVVRLASVDQFKICLDSAATVRTRVAWMAHNGTGVANAAHLHDGRYYTKAQIDALHPSEPQYLSIPPAEFQARSPADTVYSIDANGGLSVTGGPQDQFYAAVHLPDGATIEALHAWVTDKILFADPAPNLSVRLADLRYDSGYTMMASVVSLYQPTPTMLSDDTIDGNPVIDNRNRMYVVLVSVPSASWSAWGSDLQLEGVTIEYTMNG